LGVLIRKKEYQIIGALRDYLSNMIIDTSLLLRIKTKIKESKIVGYLIPQKFSESLEMYISF